VSLPALTPAAATHFLRRRHVTSAELSRRIRHPLTTAYDSDSVVMVAVSGTSAAMAAYQNADIVM